MHKIFISTFVVALAIILGVYILNQTPPAQTPPYTLTPDDVLADLMMDLNTGGTPRETKEWDWIGENGEHLPLTAKMLVVGTSGVNNMGKLGNIQNNNIEEVTSEFINEIENKTKTFYTTQGFTESKANSATYQEYTSRRNGFEKGPVKCITTLAETSDPFGYFLCGTVDQKQLDLQKDFSNLIDKEQAKEVNYTFRVLNVDGDFAKGYSSNFFTQGWFAKKTNGIWKIVFTSPDMPLCTDMEKHGIPKSVYGECYSE